KKVPQATHHHAVTCAQGSGSADAQTFVPAAGDLTALVCCYEMPAGTEEVRSWWICTQEKRFAHWRCCCCSALRQPSRRTPVNSLPWKATTGVLPPAVPVMARRVKACPVLLFRGWRPSLRAT